MQAGQAPKKTGIERREPTDEERRLIKLVNEAKKRGGYVVTDPARQLKSALNTAKTALRNRITDLEQEIATREKTVKERRPLKADAELTALRKKRDDLLKEHKKIFPPKKSPLSDARRLAMAEAALRRQISELEADLAAGRLGPKGKRTPLTSTELEAGHQRLTELRAERERAREASPEYQAQEAARQTARYKKSLERQLAFWEQRREEAKRGRLPKKRKPTPEDKAILKKKAEISAVKKETLAEIGRIKRAQRPRIQKIAEGVPEALNFLRAVLTSFDLSAVLRQGGVLSAAHPMLSRQAFVPMLKAFASEHGRAVANEMVKDLPSAALAQKAGLEITTDETTLSAMEEAYMSRLASKVPGVSHSQRAYTTFLNVQRALVFDSLAAKLGRKKEVTLDEAKVIANWVNVASGRGNLAAAQGAASTLATFFFAPRYVVSRFQMLLGQPLWTGVWKGQGGARARLLIAQEYGRMASGLALFYGTFALAAALLWDPDDEDKPTLTFDPRTPDFGKLKFGETRIDPLSGHAQAITVLGRLITRKTVTARGEVRPLTGEERKPIELSWFDVLSNFVRSKASPVLGTAIDLGAEENVVGEEVTWADVPRELTRPLIVEDVYEAMEAQGIPKGSAMGILAILGMSNQTYGEYTKYRQAKPKERKKLFERFLKNMQWDYGAPAYSEMLNRKQMKQIDARREEVRQKVLYDAAHKPNPENKTYEQQLKTRKKARETLREMDLTHKEVDQLLKDYYRYKKIHKETGEPIGSLTPSYWKRADVLEELYGVE
jgi:hypothetical protein